MRKIKTIQVSGIEIIPYEDIPYFLMQLHENNNKLLGYDFFIYSKSLGTLPDLTLSEDFSDSTLSNLERIGMSLLKILDIDNLKKEIHKMNRKDLIKLAQEGLKYLNNEKTDAIIGYEFIYE